MAAVANAERFIIDLQARYTDNGEIRRLQGELDRLGQVERLDKWRQELDRSAATIRQARDEAARLKRALDSSYDEKVLSRLHKAEAALGKLRSAYATQETAVVRGQAVVDRARLALERYSATLSATPTDKEAARQAALAAALGRAEDAHAKQRETLARTGEALNRTGQRVNELKEALRNSVDPAIRRQYEEQIRVLERSRERFVELRRNVDAATRSLGLQRADARTLIAAHADLNSAATRAAQQQAALRTLGIRSFSAIEEQVRHLERAYQALDKSGMNMVERFAVFTRYRQRIAEVREQTNGWTAAVQKLQSGWAGVVGILANLRIAQAALREFGDFETGMLKVQALTRATGSDFEGLKEKAKELGATTRYTATEAAAGMYQLAAGGLKVDEIMGTIPAALHMAAAGELEVGDAADKVTNIMAQFGMKGEAAAKKVADVMTAGFTGAATTMQQLSDAMIYCGPVANALGYSLEETTAILQTLANAGYKGEKAGTALRGGITRLIKPVRQAREVLERYGLQIMDSEGKMRPFAAIIEDIGKAGLSTADMIRLFGQEAGPGMVALIGQGAQAIRDYEAELAKADGRAEEIAEHIESGIQGSLRRLAASISAIAIAFGDTFAPVIGMAADALAKFATLVSEAPGPVKFLIGTLVTAASAYAMWKMGLATMCLGLRQFVLDAAFASKAVATKLIPSLTAARTGFLGLAAQLPLLGGLLTARAQDLLTFSGAAAKAGAALRFLGAAGALLAAWQFGKMIGEWLSGFAVVRKMALALAHELDLVGLRARKMWADLTGFGNSEALAREIEAAKKAYADMIAEIDAGTKTKTVTKTAKSAEDEEQSASKERKAVNHDKLGEVIPYTEEEDEEDEDSDHEEGDEEDDEPAPKKPKKPRTAKPRKTRKSASVGEEAEEQEEDADTGEDWLKWKHRQIAEREAAEKREREEEERRKNTRYRVYDENGKWEYAYGESKEDVERIEREAKEREAQRLASQRIVRQNNGWAQLLEGDKFVKALTAAEADALERRMAAYNRGTEQIARLAPELTSSRRRADDSAAPAPGKVVELRLGKARLHGSESDVEDFISQLERAGLSA